MDAAAGSLYPVFLNLEGKSVLLVGGGDVAFRKARALRESACRLTVVAKNVTSPFKAWLEEKRIQWQERPYEEGEAAGYFLVVSATDDPVINRRVYEDACRADRLVNVVDQPHLCNLYIPSVVKRGELQVAVSTSGLCPALARWLRLELDQWLPKPYGPLLKSLSVIREQFKKTLPTPTSRKEAMEKVLASEEVRRFLEGDPDPLERMLETLVTSTSKEPSS